MGAQLSSNRLREQFRAGWATEAGEVETFSHVDGPGSFRFEVTSPQGRTFVFDGVGAVAMAICQANADVSARMSSGRAVELIVAGAARGGYGQAARQARNTVWAEDPAHVFTTGRHKAARALADRIVCLTRHADLYAGHPQWHPAWRVNELDNAVVPAQRTETNSGINSMVGVA